VLLQRERYDAVFTLLPTAETHGHHRAATLLTLEAVGTLAGKKPLVFGVDARGAEERPFQFTGLPSEPLTRTVAAAPVLTFDRATPFGFRDALSYRIVVNWLIAEHKSQGLFQTDTGQDRFEQFWLFEAGSQEASGRLAELQKLFCSSRAQALAHLEKQPTQLKGTSK
jgi:prenyltransferase beta subunit